VRNFAPPTYWRLKAALTGTLGSVPLRRGGRHLCLPVSAASSRVVLLAWGWCEIAPVRPAFFACQVYNRKVLSFN